MNEESMTSTRAILITSGISKFFLFGVKLEVEGINESVNSIVDVAVNYFPGSKSVVLAVRERNIA